MDKSEMFAAITIQRRRLADTLEGLTDEQWNTASLCSGWRTREVVAHLLSILEIPIGKFLMNVAKAHNFDRYADQVAREIGAAAPSELLRRYRAVADLRFAPPLVGPIAPLTDTFVHTRDIERPLGLKSELDPTALHTVLNYVCGNKARGFVPASRTKGLRFVANDIDWSIGAGPEVIGSGEAIMMAVTSRRVALDDLNGPGVDQLSQRT